MTFIITRELGKGRTSTEGIVTTASQARALRARILAAEPYAVVTITVRKG